MKFKTIVICIFVVILVFSLTIFSPPKMGEGMKAICILIISLVFIILILYSIYRGWKDKKVVE